MGNIYNNVLSIPEGKMGVKPLVKPPWTLTDFEQKELDSQECPQPRKIAKVKQENKQTAKNNLQTSTENCSQQYHVTTWVSSVRRKSDKKLQLAPKLGKTLLLS